MHEAASGLRDGICLESVGRVADDHEALWPKQEAKYLHACKNQQAVPGMANVWMA